MLPYAAYLRVYEPLSAFPPGPAAPVVRLRRLARPAAVSAHGAGESEFAAAMFHRFTSRWHGLEALQRAS